MGSVIMGLIIGVILALLVLMVGCTIAYECDGIGNIITWVVVSSLCIGTIVVSVWLPVEFDKNYNSRWIQTYTIQKETIEQAIKGDELSDIEKFELLSQINNLNSQLVGKQYDCQQWHGFNIDKKVMELEPISIGK